MEHQGEEVKGQSGVALAPSDLFGLLHTRSQGGQTVRGPVRRPYSQALKRQWASPSRGGDIGPDVCLSLLPTHHPRGSGPNWDDHKKVGQPGFCTREK